MYIKSHSGERGNQIPCRTVLASPSRDRFNNAKSLGLILLHRPDLILGLKIQNESGQRAAEQVEQHADQGWTQHYSLLVDEITEGWLRFFR